jgi:hypothetical protein
MPNPKKKVETIVHTNGSTSNNRWLNPAAKGSKTPVPSLATRNKKKTSKSSDTTPCLLGKADIQ